MGTATVCDACGQTISDGRVNQVVLYDGPGFFDVCMDCLDLLRSESLTFSRMESSGRSFHDSRTAQRNLRLQEEQEATRP